MTFETPIGGGKTVNVHRDRTEDALIAEGRYTKTIYLNGGSDTRRGVREFYREYYRGSNTIEVFANGWCVIIRRRDQ